MFAASDYAGQQFVIDRHYVETHLSEMMIERDLGKFLPYTSPKKSNS